MSEAIDKLQPCQQNPMKINQCNDNGLCGECWGSSWKIQFHEPCSVCKGTGKRQVDIKPKNN